MIKDKVLDLQSSMSLGLLVDTEFVFFNLQHQMEGSIWHCTWQNSCQCPMAKKLVWSHSWSDREQNKFLPPRRNKPNSLVIQPTT